MAQLHKKFTDIQIREILARYLKGEIPRRYVQELLGIKARRFFDLVKLYRDNPGEFSIRYQRKEPTRQIPHEAEKAILKELAIDKKILEDKENPVRRYNYSFIKDRLGDTHGLKVSVPTIIDRAKKYGFYLKRPARSKHEREVLTHYVGELIQHDSSWHLWAPSAGEKWHLITSLDDHSRFILYADLVPRESSWAHIIALEAVFLKHGFPFSYYVDSHSIFRFVQGRDSIWRDHKMQTDDIDPQWKQVLKDCGVKLLYALSPQAKGKIERPYQWIQDRLVRLCVRNDVKDIRQARTLLQGEIQRYNYRQVHSTTSEVPYFRFQKALKDKRSLFRQFHVQPPFKSPKDIFCLRLERTVDAYCRISVFSQQSITHRQLRQSRRRSFGPILSDDRWGHRDAILARRSVAGRSAHQNQRPDWSAVLKFKLCTFKKRPTGPCRLCDRGRGIWVLSPNYGGPNIPCYLRRCRLH